jgi:hypothetical protein
VDEPVVMTDGARVRGLKIHSFRESKACTRTAQPPALQRYPDRSRGVSSGSSGWASHLSLTRHVVDSEKDSNGPGGGPASNDPPQQAKSPTDVRVRLTRAGTPYSAVFTVTTESIVCARSALPSASSVVSWPPELVFVGPNLTGGSPHSHEALETKEQWSKAIHDRVKGYRPADGRKPWTCCGTETNCM